MQYRRTAAQENELYLKNGLFMQGWLRVKFRVLCVGVLLRHLVLSGASIAPSTLEDYVWGDLFARCTTFSDLDLPVYLDMAPRGKEGMLTCLFNAPSA